MTFENFYCILLERRQMMIKINYNPITSEIIGLPKFLIPKLKGILSYESKSKIYSFAYQQGKWNGIIYLIRNNKFPSGLLYLVEHFLQKQDLEYEILNKKFPSIIGNLTIDSLREYQKEALEICLKEGRGVIHAPMGSGKTRLAAAITESIGRNTLFLVPRKELVLQHKTEFENCSSLKIGEIIGEAGVRKFNKNPWEFPIYIAMFPTIFSNRSDCKKLLQETEILLLDEVHRAPCKTLYSVAMSCPAPFRFGFSGTTEGRSDNADLKIRAVTGKIIFKQEMHPLVENGFLAKATVIFIDCKNDALNLIEWENLYRVGVVENKIRNQKIIKIVQDSINREKSCYIIVSRIRHGEILKKMCDFAKCDFIYGDLDIDTRNSVLNKFRSKEINVLIISPIGDEGIDLPNIETLILASGQKAPIQVMQRIGRGLRHGESGKVLIFDFWDNWKGNKILYKHSRLRKKIYEQAGFKIVKL